MAGGRHDGREARQTEVGAEALFQHRFTTLRCSHHSTQLNRAARGQGGKRGSRQPRCGLHARGRELRRGGRKEGRKEGWQAPKCAYVRTYQPTDSCRGAVPRKVVRRCCSQFERVKGTRAREGKRERGRERRKAGCPHLTPPLSRRCIRPV